MNLFRHFMPVTYFQNETVFYFGELERKISNLEVSVGQRIDSLEQKLVLSGSKIKNEIREEFYSTVYRRDEGFALERQLQRINSTLTNSVEKTSRRTSLIEKNIDDLEAKAQEQDRKFKTLQRYTGIINPIFFEN